jgi:sugar phosphate isomerase/epimerase
MIGTISWTCNATLEASAELWLEEMAAIGYTYVEHASGVLGYGSAYESGLDGSSPRLGMTAKQFKAALDNAGVKCLAGHHIIGWPFTVEAWKPVFEDALIIGEWYAGLTNATPTTLDECKRYADAIHKVAQLGRSMGFRGSLFQHYDVGAWTPLTDRPDLRPIDVVMANTSAKDFHAELDTNHALQQLGSIGAVIAEVRKFRGRILQFHMKDGIAPVAPNTAATELASSVEFGLGDWGRPDPSDPTGRPHAGFQDLISAIYATQPWSKVLLITESDTSGPTCVDYAALSYHGLNGLNFSKQC